MKIRKNNTEPTKKRYQNIFLNKEEEDLYGSFIKNQQLQLKSLLLSSFLE